MTTKRRPGAEDRLNAIRVALQGIAFHADPLDVARALATLHPKNNTFPGEVLLGLAADALEEARASRDSPVAFEGIRERFLPEIEFRGRVEHHKSRYALQAAAMIHGGVEPDVLGEVTWWTHDDLWRWSLYALVIYLRVAAERTGTSVGLVCQSVATPRGGPQPGRLTFGRRQETGEWASSPATPCSRPRLCARFSDVWRMRWQTIRSARSSNGFQRLRQRSAVPSACHNEWHEGVERGHQR